MRDLTKSMMSYSWAMSVFGVQQMINLLRPSKATNAFEGVTQATENELGDVLKATFRAGDSIQRGLVDLSFSAFTLGGTLNPANVTNTAAGLGQRVAQGFGQAASEASSTQTASASPQGAQASSAGWGPIPPQPDK